MNAPPNSTETTHRSATRVVAYVGADGATTVDLSEESEAWQVVRIEQGLGANQRAILQRDLGKMGERVENRTVGPASTRVVEIWALDEDGERVRSLFRGELMKLNVAVAAGAELEFAEVILPPAWFGDLCEGQQVYDPDDDDLTIVDLDLEFNPLVDGRLIDNCAEHEDGVTGVEHDTWIDPESVRSSEAEQVYNVDAVTAWTIDKAVRSLQGYLNPDETYVDNFETQAGDDPRDPQFEESPELEDLVLPRGHYLPAYLDSLLPQYGHQWTVDFTLGDDDATQITPRIFVYRRGEGTLKVIPYQAIGESLDVAKTQPLSLDVQLDLSQLANVVVGAGSLEEREVTIELSRGWPESDDATPLSDLDKTTAPIANDNTWRKWVGNEAGDYIGTRAELTEALDLSSVFPNGYVPKRRPVEDCLTFRAASADDASRLPPILEYSIDDGTTWIRYTDHDWRPLTHELGVYLTEPQADGLVKVLHDAGDDAKLRLTGTIRGDRRPRVEVDRFSTSPSSIESRLFLDVSHRFHDRQRATGEHGSMLSGSYDQADDQTELEAFAEKVADNVQAASVGAALPLHGLVFDYMIGDIVEDIEGRNLSLNRNATDADEPQGVQVVGIVYDVQSQRTLLTVLPFDSYITPPRRAA